MRKNLAKDDALSNCCGVVENFLEEFVFDVLIIALDFEVFDLDVRQRISPPKDIFVF